MMKKTKLVKRIMLSLIIAILVICASVFFAFYFLTTPVSSDSTTKEIIITDGMTGTDVATLLKENNLIKNETIFRLLLKIRHVDVLYAAKYSFSEDMTTYEIIEAIESGGTNQNEFSITFQEGVDMRDVAKIIADNTDNTEEDVFNKLKDTTYIDSLIAKYWFLTDEIKDPNIYYPLEGYLYPDTYNIASSKTTVEEIFSSMLDKMDTVLTTYKSDIEASSYSVHQLLTLASLTELEGLDLESRQGIAGVFYNRLNGGMSLGSDVTTYYGLQIDISDRDLTEAELNESNAYNTRSADMAGKFPVGPISTVSEEAIEAALYPKDNDYLFFVSDKNGNIYFSSDEDEHYATVERLQSEGLWYEW